MTDSTPGAPIALIEYKIAHLDMEISRLQEALAMHETRKQRCVRELEALRQERKVFLRALTQLKVFEAAEDDSDVNEAPEFTRDVIERHVPGPGPTHGYPGAPKPDHH